MKRNEKCVCVCVPKKERKKKTSKKTQQKKYTKKCLGAFFHLEAYALLRSRQPHYLNRKPLDEDETKRVCVCVRAKERKKEKTSKKNTQKKYTKKCLGLLRLCFVSASSLLHFVFSSFFLHPCALWLGCLSSFFLTPSASSSRNKIL